jgi:hypothetical protein
VLAKHFDNDRRRTGLLVAALVALTMVSVPPLNTNENNGSANVTVNDDPSDGVHLMDGNDNNIAYGSIGIGHSHDNAMASVSHLKLFESGQPDQKNRQT